MKQILLLCKDMKEKTLPMVTDPGSIVAYDQPWKHELKKLQIPNLSGHTGG